jgi:DNA-directed RNA polymerase alpha subunit
MISLKFNQSIAGNNFSHQRGDEVDWYDDHDALSLIDAGIAKPTDEAGKQAYADYRARKLADPKPAKPSKPEKPSAPEPLDTPPAAPTSTQAVDSLDLDEATIKVLKAAGLQTVGDVLSHPDLTEIQGIGKATAAKILKAVSESVPPQS